VRLGTGPSIEEAVGNTNEEITLCGSYIRIRTDNGKCSSQRKHGIDNPNLLSRCIYCVYNSRKTTNGKAQAHK
jgi:hypothetical protein